MVHSNYRSGRHDVITDTAVQQDKESDITDRAHSLDAGIDFYVPADFEQKGLAPGEALRIKSGIKVNVPQGYALIAFNKSGISTKLGLIVGACVIDSGYQGEISIHIINTSNKNIWILPDMKIVQYILVPIAESIPEEVKESELFPHILHVEMVALAALI